MPALLDTALDRTIVLGYSRAGYAARRHWWRDDPLPPMPGRTVVITGATSGLGLAAAEGFAALGARVVLVGRDAARTGRAREQVARRAGAGPVDVALCDLAVLADVRRLAAELAAAHPRIDVLVNNAGALPPSRTVTGEGNELTLATNVLGPHLLTRLLLDPLCAAAPGRVINVTSGGMYTQKLAVGRPARARRAPSTAPGPTRAPSARRWCSPSSGRSAWTRPRSSSTRCTPAGPTRPGLAASLPRFHRLAGPLLRTARAGRRHDRLARRRRRAGPQHGPALARPRATAHPLRAVDPGERRRPHGALARLRAADRLVRGGVGWARMPAAPTRLLIAFDGSGGAAGAVRAAAALFGGARAVVVSVSDGPRLAEQAASAAARLGVDPERFAALERTADEHAAATASDGAALAGRLGLTAESDTATGDSAAAAILGAAQRGDADVIVCGARGLGGFSRAALGSTSSSLLHRADRPLLVVPEGAGDASGPVVIGYDGSEGARAAVEAAGRLFPGHEALVVNVWESPVRHTVTGRVSCTRRSSRSTSSPPTSTGASPRRPASSPARARPWRASRGSWPSPARSRRARRRGAGCFAGARSAGASVIVAGSRGRGGVSAALLGSVSAGLVHNADLPVLIVRG